MYVCVCVWGGGGWGMPKGRLGPTNGGGSIRPTEGDSLVLQGGQDELSLYQGAPKLTTTGRRQRRKGRSMLGKYQSPLH